MSFHTMLQAQMLELFVAISVALYDKFTTSLVLIGCGVEAT